MELDPNTLDPRILLRNFAMEEPLGSPPQYQLPAPRPPGENQLPGVSSAPTATTQEPDSVGGGGVRTEKPYGFAIRNGIDGARIYFGSLLVTVTTLDFEKKPGVGNVLNVLAGQRTIPTVSQHIPSNFDDDTFGYKNAKDLSWFGGIYLYWETDKDCLVTMCDIRGPDEPTGFEVPILSGDLERVWGEETGGKYFVKLGNVDEATREITQLISGDVTWSVAFIPENPEDVDPLTIDVEDTVTLVEQRATSPVQVHVNSRAVTDPERALGYSKAFTVEGNSHDASLTINVTTAGSLVSTAVNWVDGLIDEPESKTVNIVIPAAIPGPTGSTGATGATGATGPTGPAGADGEASWPWGDIGDWAPRQIWICESGTPVQIWVLASTTYTP